MVGQSPVAGSPEITALPVAPFYSFGPRLGKHIRRADFRKKVSPAPLRFADPNRPCDADAPTTSGAQAVMPLRIHGLKEPAPGGTFRRYSR